MGSNQLRIPKRSQAGMLVHVTYRRFVLSKCGIDQPNVRVYLGSVRNGLKNGVRCRCCCQERAFRSCTVPGRSRGLFLGLAHRRL
jgi:hypothetical protein